MGKLDDFLDDLQQQIFDEAKEAYGEKGFQRWRTPCFHGRMPDADVHSRVTGTTRSGVQREKDNRSRMIYKKGYGGA